MKIAAYLKTSLIEWPGKISSVIFTPGCNFRCPFCHNADLVDPERLKRVPLIKEEEIFEDLNARKEWTDAVIITGGEPTLQKDLLLFLRRLKEMGFLTMMHTNGTNPEMVQQLFQDRLIDNISMDLKGNFSHYEKFNGVKTEIAKLKESIRLITNSGIEYEFRTTIIPGLHDFNNLKSLAEDLKNAVQESKYKGQLKWYLQQFRPLNCLDQNFLKISPYSSQELTNMQKKLEQIISSVFLRGV